MIPTINPTFTVLVCEVGYMEFEQALNWQSVTVDVIIQRLREGSVYNSSKKL